MSATECVAQEFVILVDEQNRQTGIAEKLEAHQKNLLHRAFSIFIFREEATREILLQQRAFHKYHSGGLWTNTCCSHPRPGESILSAGQRRLQEELGIVATLEEAGWFQYHAQFGNGLSEHEIDHVLIGHMDRACPIFPHADEVHATRWITVQALRKELAKHPERFTPWFEQALSLCPF